MKYSLNEFQPYNLSMFDKNGIKTIEIQECTGADSLQVPIIQRYNKQYKKIKQIKSVGHVSQFLVQQVHDMQSNVLQTDQPGEEKNDKFTLTVISKFNQIDADFERKNLKMLRAALLQKCISSKYLLKTYYVCDDETDIILIQDPIYNTLSDYHQNNRIYIQNEKSLVKIEQIVDQLSRAIRFFHQNKIHSIQLSPDCIGYEEQESNVKIYLINFEVDRVIQKLESQNQVINDAFNRPQIKDYPDTYETRKAQKLITKLESDLIISNTEGHNFEAQKQINRKPYDRDLWGIGAIAHYLLFQTQQTQYYLDRQNVIERYLHSNMKFYMDSVKSEYLRNIINSSLIKNYDERKILTLTTNTATTDEILSINQIDLAYLRYVHRKILIFDGKTKIKSNIQLSEMQVL